MRRIPLKLQGSRDRFKEAPWYNPDQKVTIGGLGSIGSWLTLFMGKLVNTIYVYDFDEVEAHNMSGQFYDRNDVGSTKANATIRKASLFNPDATIRARGEFKEDSGVTPVSFACFDNMKARREMFESWKKLDDRTLFVDGRLTAEQYWVYAVTKDNEDIYDTEYLVSDSDIEDLPCSFKSTTHISAALASAMTTVFTNYTHNQIIPDIRELPFEVTFVASMMHQTKS